VTTLVNLLGLVKLMSAWSAVLLLLQIGTMNHMPPEMLRSGQMSVVSDTRQALQKEGRQDDRITAVSCHL
jgi:hypothetical protein